MWNKNENKIKVHIIRHGMTLLNEKHCYIGITDDSLSKNGINALKDKMAEGIYPNTNIVYVSPMKRAIETAKILYSNAQIIQIDDFMETNFGSFEGKNYEELKDNPYYRRWIDEAYGMSQTELIKLYSNLKDASLKNIVLPEKSEDVNLRVRRGFLHVLKQTECEKEIAIIAHGGTIASICSSFTEDDYYKFMTACGEGVSVDITYGINENGAAKISCFSIVNRICS